jgi:Ni/Fe-hydrogenase subunit HybB-like protein
MKFYRLIRSISLRFPWKKILNTIGIIAIMIVIIVFGIGVYGLIRAFKGL